MPSPHSNRQVRLAEHVCACQVEDQMIFLDLHKDKYIGVGGPQLPALCAALLGHHALADIQDVQSHPALMDEWLRRLRHQQLLSDGPPTKPVRARHALVEPACGLTVEDEELAGASTGRHLLRLWHATVVTASWLRRRRLAEIADRVETLRTRNAHRQRGLSVHFMRAEAARYTRLRPFALTTYDRCLNDSLAQIHFLATQGLFPQWVIGVRVRPFGAHSWVQSGDVVLNDLPENVRHYRPILVV